MAKKKTLQDMGLEELRIEHGWRLICLFQIIDHIEIAKDGELKQYADHVRESYEELTKRFNPPHYASIL